MEAAIVLFTRDLRVRDHPALATACSAAERVVPLFVLDDGILGSGYAAPNRLRFLLEALRDLRSSLRERGGDLVVRQGDPVTEVMRLAADTRAEGLILSADVSAYAGRRDRRLEQECERHRLYFRRAPGVTVIPPGEIQPTTGGHYRVFTPYWGAWRAASWRWLSETPHAVRLPEGVDGGALPSLADLTSGRPSPDVTPGGEGAGRSRLEAWLRDGLRDYGSHHDDLPGDRTSRVSPYLHFGCLSPREVAEAAAGRKGGEPFLRQLAWRDFYHQVTAAFPEISYRDYRSHDDRWREDPEALQAWKDGQTGYPIVDAGMRQLAREGGCTTGHGSWSRRFLPRTCISTGAAGGSTSSTCSSTGTSPTTSVTGSGWRAPATTPALPGAQPRPAGAALRPGGCVRAAVRTGTGRGGGARGARAVEARPANARGARLPAADRRPGGEAGVYPSSQRRLRSRSWPAERASVNWDRPR